MMLAVSSLAASGAGMKAQVSRPTLSPVITTITGNTPVYLSDTTPGTTIIYTLDNSQPTAINGFKCKPSSTVPCFTLVGGAKLKAIAEDANGNLSDTLGHTYTAASSYACVGWNPQNMYADNDFTAVQISVTSKAGSIPNPSSLGVDCEGGGYIDGFDTGYGNFGGLIAVPYGRGFQTDIRDNLHSGLYNPTQAGITDGDGTPITLAYTDSPLGPGGRINIVPYQLPLFLNQRYCFFPLGYYSPNDPNTYSFCDSSTVTDGIWNQEVAANISAAQQLRSEFAMSGFYQDASNLGNNAAAIFQYNFTMTYNQNPGAPNKPGSTTWLSPQVSNDYSPIYKFGPAATYTNNGVTTNVLNTSYLNASYAIPAYSDVTNPGSLTSVVPTNIDLVQALVATNIRLVLSGSYTEYATLNSTCDGWSAPQSFDLTATATTYNGTIFPQPSWPCGSVLAFQNPNDANAPMIAMYFPQTDPVNAQQITETNVMTGQTINLDRRYDAGMLARSWINAKTPNLTVNGITYENQFTQIIPTMRVTGMLAPNHAGPNINESINQDIYVLVGSPAEVLSSLQSMNAKQGWNW